MVSGGKIVLLQRVLTTNVLATAEAKSMAQSSLAPADMSLNTETENAVAAISRLATPVVSSLEVIITFMSLVAYRSSFVLNIQANRFTALSNDSSIMSSTTGSSVAIGDEGRAGDEE